MSVAARPVRHPARDWVRARDLWGLRCRISRVLSPAGSRRCPHHSFHVKRGPLVEKQAPSVDSYAQMAIPGRWITSDAPGAASRNAARAPRSSGPHDRPRSPVVRATGRPASRRARSCHRGGGSPALRRRAPPERRNPSSRGTIRRTVRGGVTSVSAGPSEPPLATSPRRTPQPTSDHRAAPRPVPDGRSRCRDPFCAQRGPETWCDAATARPKLNSGPDDGSPPPDRAAPRRSRCRRPSSPRASARR